MLLAQYPSLINVGPTTLAAVLHPSQGVLQSVRTGLSVILEADLSGLAKGIVYLSLGAC